MPSVDLRPKGKKKEMSFEVAMRKFKKAVERAGTLQKAKEKEFYEKPTSKKKRQKAESIIRWRKKERQLAQTGWEQPRSRS
jgi:small subunit ribosomal protein S21